MKKLDYIIVGCGLAGVAFCEILKSKGKSFIVIDDQSQKSSLAAAGLYNPVILKRFTEVWKAKEQLDLASSFYNKLEKQFLVDFDFKLPIYRRFASVEEQNEWFTASDQPHLEGFLLPEVIKNKNPYVIAPFGFGEVLKTGRIDTLSLIHRYKQFLINGSEYLNETFEHHNLQIEEDILIYKNFVSKRIVFAEGFGMIKNPFFNELPLNVAKGEIITIKAPKLKIKYILKSSIFVVPIREDIYSVGATYNWKDKTHDISEEAKNELVRQLKQLITCDFEVIGQVAGIRPTVRDRRPLVGVHGQHQNIAILNGLGTRGVMIAPYAAKQLFEYLEYEKPIDIEMDIKRFN